MPNVKGCNLPDELLYDVENHIWFKELGDGTVRVGMTTVATAMAGQLVAFTPKSGAGSEGRRRVRPSSRASGSGRPVAAAGSVVAINEALVANPSTANADPYGEGWLIVLKPEDWDGVKPSLVPGAQVAAPYEAKMAADGFAGCA
jgi:glycine cleavage system H protein